MRHYIAIIAIAVAFGSCGNSAKDPARDSAGKQMAETESDAGIIAEVTVMDLEPSLFSHDIASNGRLTANEKVDVYFQNRGIISDIYVRNGQHVAKGQKIAALDIHKLQNQLAKDQTAVESARLEMQDIIIGQGFDPLHQDKVPSDIMELARLKSGLNLAELSLAATQLEIREATLAAPIDGTIANLITKPHNMSSVSEPLCRIINERNMDVEFSVLESELAMIRPGDRVTVVPFSQGESREGIVKEINPMVDENGMVKVWASVSGSSGMIDGMNVRVAVRRDVEKALVVPKSAVVLRSGRQVVFTLDDNNGDKAIWNYVTTGLENLGEYTVTEGLIPGMKVIISGNLNLAHDAPVRVVGQNEMKKR